MIGFSDAGLAATPACDGGCNLILGAGAAEATNQQGAAIDLNGDGGTELPAQGATIVGNQIGLGNGITNQNPPNRDGLVVGDATDVRIGGPAAGNADRNLVAGSISSGAAASGLVIQNNVVEGSSGGHPATNALNLRGSGQVLDNILANESKVHAAIALDDTSAPNFLVQGNLSVRTRTATPSMPAAGESSSPTAPTAT